MPPWKDKNQQNGYGYLPEKIINNLRCRNGNDRKFSLKTVNNVCSSRGMFSYKELFQQKKRRVPFKSIAYMHGGNT